MFTLILLVVALSGVIQGEPSTTSAPSSANNTEQQVIKKIDTALKEVNNYITEFLELIVKLVKVVSEFINDLQSGNSTHISMSELNSIIKTSFNSSSDKCTSEEHRKIKVLLTNTTDSILSCYSDVSGDIKELIPEVETVLSIIIHAVKNITEGVNNCFQNNPMIFGLPGCIMDEVNFAKNEYEILSGLLNKTVTTGMETVSDFARDTKNCLNPIVSDFVMGFTKILTNFVECVYGSG